MSKCPNCGHSTDAHNDAGSEPAGDLGGRWPDGVISQGQMCCYAAPNEGETGVKNWGSRVCGCDYFPGGDARRYY